MTDFTINALLICSVQDLGSSLASKDLAAREAALNKREAALTEREATVASKEQVRASVAERTEA